MAREEEAWKKGQGKKKTWKKGQGKKRNGSKAKERKKAWKKGQGEKRHGRMRERSKRSWSMEELWGGGGPGKWIKIEEWMEKGGEIEVYIKKRKYRKESKKKQRWE